MQYIILAKIFIMFFLLKWEEVIFEAQNKGKLICINLKTSGPVT